MDVIHTSAKKNEVLRPPETVDGDEQAVSQRLATEARVGLHLRLLVGEGEGEGEVEGGGEGISSLSLLFRLVVPVGVEFAPNKSKQKTWGCSG